jgi:hypothetical protein
VLNRSIENVLILVDDRERPSGVAEELGKPVSCPRNSMYFVAIKMGRRQGARSGAYLNRYVTDEQRGRRPIFIATLRAGAGWPFFCVALSARIDSDMGARSRLEKQPTDFRQNICYFGDRTLGGVVVRIEHLGVGDYSIDGAVLIERKTATDFAQSLMDGRLFSQAKQMANSPLRTAYILEGTSVE